MQIADQKNGMYLCMVLGVIDTSLLLWRGGEMLAEHDFGAWFGTKCFSQPFAFIRLCHSKAGFVLVTSLYHDI